MVRTDQQAPDWWKGCDEDGFVFIDRDGSRFGLILNYLRQVRLQTKSRLAAHELAASKRRGSNSAAADESKTESLLSRRRSSNRMGTSTQDLKAAALTFVASLGLTRAQLAQEIIVEAHFYRLPSKTFTCAQRNSHITVDSALAQALDDAVQTIAKQGDPAASASMAAELVSLRSLVSSLQDELAELHVEKQSLEAAVSGQGKQPPVNNDELFALIKVRPRCRCCRCWRSHQRTGNRRLLQR